MTPKNHPRYESLLLREKIKDAYKEGYLSDSGMIAHGRGETFDYLLGEKTTESSRIAIDVSVAKLLLAENPVISINGNTTALVIDEIIQLAKLIPAKIEINLFYRNEKRIDTIENILNKKGYDNVLGTNKDELLYIKDIKNPRATASKNGIYSSDLILIPLEDGDRTEILVDSGKEVIAIDLNPLSRTSKKANITIVDNIIRVIPLMIEITKKFRSYNKEKLKDIIKDFSNKDNLKESLKCIDLNRI
ncbi:MAG: phosphopantothenate/pantothenate synthetase [Methanobrevibacter sp.]|jgi:4-phosphopantoate--beta-alanine ligase|nr:phosphopantothenate/pantothenate synthetase [Candidatus Methanovirga basalitermitum]